LFFHTYSTITQKMAQKPGVLLVGSGGIGTIAALNLDIGGHGSSALQL
jgi:hypothetical protein